MQHQAGSFSFHSRPKIRVLSSGVLLWSLAAGSIEAAQNPAASADTKPPEVVLTAGPEWIPLKPELDLEPGSALDFSGLGWIDAPAGKHGRVIARPDGQFAFADSPEQPRRFYGVNLCFGAHYLSQAEADRLAERLARLGYNALRVHHYERDLIQGQSNSVTLNPQKLEQLDYLFAALKKRGLYLTTDLYVSRPVPWRDLGVERDGQVPMDTFKILVPVHPGARANWEQFVRAFLGHRNPHTGLRYAEDPALAWLAMINEGNFGNFFRDLKTFPEWKQTWNRWLARRYPDRNALRQAWGETLQAEEDPARASVALPENLGGKGLRVRDCIAFLSDTEREMVRWMKALLREELGCRALISNANSWTYFVTDQATRETYDYVDDHFYVDHPQFLQQSWRLPSRCPNTSPIAGGAEGGRSRAFTRLLDKPFTITEYNYSAPGRFRGVGGILTGALGALQGWSGIWRFAYSHSRNAMFEPARLGYFDLASDPLSQAAERASMCLFLRGDLKTAPHSVALAMSEADLVQPAERIPNLAPKWHWLAWITRLGTAVLRSPEEARTHTLVLPLGWQTPATAYPAGQTLAADPYAVDSSRLLNALKERQVVPSGNPTEPERKVLRSETGQILIDGPRDVLVLDTPRTAGGYAPAGGSLETDRGVVRIELAGSDATVWVSALDGASIPQSRRLLVTHLTDVQNTRIRYAEAARQTLLEWGELPHLARAGTARLAIRLDAPARFHVWALTTGGRRAAEVACKVRADRLEFVADVAGDPAAGARMLYEVALE